MTSLYLEQSLPELTLHLTDGAISYKDVIEATIQTIEEYAKDTHAWACYDLDALRREFEGATKRSRIQGGPFGIEGIPFGVKDIFNTKAFPTEMGSPIWKGFTPGNNARVVDSLVVKGGLVAGKTVTAEFAVHALNATLNPHDPSRTPGTSSSGSAVVVATGMVPFALATQTAGSIVRPASFCGVWGMKPSFGMIPRTGVLKTTDSLDTVGFLASRAKSLRTILDCVRVKGPDYPFVYKKVDTQGNYPKQRDKPWRVGFVKTHIWPKATDYAQHAIQELADRIGNENGFSVEEIEWPDEMHTAHDLHATIYTKSLSYYFQREQKMLSEITPIMRKMISMGKSIGVIEFMEALRDQELYCERLEHLLADYDIVLSLSTSSSAPPRGTDELPDPSLIWTLGHVPAISVPMFRCPDYLPFGAQFIARRWNDYLLLQGIEKLVDRGILPAGSQRIHRGCTQARKKLFEPAMR